MHTTSASNRHESEAAWPPYRLACHVDGTWHSTWHSTWIAHGLAHGIAYGLVEGASHVADWGFAQATPHSRAQRVRFGI